MTDKITGCGKTKNISSSFIQQILDAKGGEKFLICTMGKYIQIEVTVQYKTGIILLSNEENKEVI